MVTRLLHLPLELLTIVCEQYLAWNDTLQLSQTHPILRKCLPLAAYTEEDWRNLLMARGIGRSILDRERSWREMACSIAFHATICRACEPALRKAEEQKVSMGGALRVLSREEARGNEHIAINSGIVYRYGRVSRFRAWPSPHPDPLVWLYGGVPLADRARLSFPLAMKYLQLETKEAYLLYEALKRSSPHPLKEAFFADKKMRLDQHIVISSLLATNQPIAEVIMDVRDEFTGDQFGPYLAVLSKEFRVANKDGLTVIDLLRNLTDWHEEEDATFPERTPLPFAGLDWQPDEVMPDYPEEGQTTPVQILVRYDDLDERDEADILNVECDTWLLSLRESQYYVNALLS